ncbi:MAG: U32 family peptidase [Eubacterium sp.]|nr:U32 family peptidase [Eubacterium sp.]
MKPAELLAPAGTPEAFQAAISAGADAVYLGGSLFGARAYAGNFTRDQLLSALDYAHLRDKKVYLTVNTLLKDAELGLLYDYLFPFYEAGLDAVIVQDYGVLAFIKESFPDLPLHASTQMAVTGAGFAKLLKERGVTRVIPARELSLTRIRQIREESGLDVEVFVHGALCYCISGMCLMSSLLGGRSGNRGRCAQPCRLPYSVFDKTGSPLSGERNAYALNTKDMCAADLLPKLLEAGVSSFKIEGRMKRPEYVAGVVSVYRKYLDECLAGSPARLSSEDREFLLSFNNRDGFHDSYFFRHNGRDMMAPENRKLSVSRAKKAETAYELVREKYLEKEPKISLYGRFAVKEDKPVSAVISDGKLTVSFRGEIPSAAQKRPVTYEELEKRLSETGGSEFEFKKLDIELDDGLFLPVGQQKDLRRQALSAFREEKLSQKKRPAPDRCSDPFVKKENRKAPEKCGFSVSVTDRRQLEEVLENPAVDTVYLPLHMLESADTEKTPFAAIIKASGKKPALEMPYIVLEPYPENRLRLIKEAAEEGFEFLVRNPEDLAFLTGEGLADRIRADYTLYTMNGLSKEFLKGFGIRKFTAPLELNARELKIRDNSEDEIILYGRTHLMVSAQCLKKNYDRCTKDYSRLVLKDRTGADFPVFMECGTCTNIIYNSVPVSLLGVYSQVKELGFPNFRACFTLESPGEVRRILDGIAGLMSGGPDFKESFSFTRGHFNRKVE